MTLTLTPTVTSAASSNAATSCPSTAFKSPGKLTVGNNNLIFEPWFMSNAPSNGKGYESSVVYALAKKLGFRSAEVKWVTLPSDDALSTGVKSVDLYVNELSSSAERSSLVTFSASYYDVRPSVIVLKSSTWTQKRSLRDLARATFGYVNRTVGVSTVSAMVKPTRPFIAFPTVDQAVSALKAKQIDALLIDTPTGNYLVNWQFVDKKGKSLATQIGQFTSVGDYYAFALPKNSGLVSCVNAALATLRVDGTLEKLSREYLKNYNDVPLYK
jgi:polar amino acid transport system substrate-binding protein